MCLQEHKQAQREERKKKFLQYSHNRFYAHVLSSRMSPPRLSWFLSSVIPWN